MNVQYDQPYKWTKCKWKTARSICIFRCIYLSYLSIRHEQMKKIILITHHTCITIHTKSHFFNIADYGDNFFSLCAVCNLSQRRARRSVVISNYSTNKTITLPLKPILYGNTFFETFLLIHKKRIHAIQEWLTVYLYVHVSHLKSNRFWKSRFPCDSALIFVNHHILLISNFYLLKKSL